MVKSSASRKAPVKQTAKALQTLFECAFPSYTEIVEAGIKEYLEDAKRLFLEALMQSEVNHRAGTSHSRNRPSPIHRWGYEQGVAVVDGAKTAVLRPRIRVQRNLEQASKELHLETYKAMNRSELMDGPLLACILSGVSARNYSKIVYRGLRAKGVSKSAVSRKAIAATKPDIDKFLNRKLDELRLVALFFDGVNVGGRQAIACVAVDNVGRKHAIGLRFGGTENEIVCRDLLRDLAERGLNMDSRYLFVIDGSKALASAIRTRFGQSAAIQRCQEHKIRDIQAYLPVSVRMQFRQKLLAAYGQRTEKAAFKRLEIIRLELARFGEKAVNALTEGLYETLTVHRLGITGELRRSLKTTNIIESAFSAVRRHLRGVSNYRNEEQRERWIIRGILEAERNFRCLPGNRQLGELKQKLEKYTATN